MLMPPLIQKWNMLKDEDKDLFPLLEVNVKILHTFYQCILATALSNKDAPTRKCYYRS